MEFTWPVIYQPHNVTTHSLSLNAVGLQAWAANQADMSATAEEDWGGANRAYYIPFVIAEPIIAVKMFHINGASATGNLDLGIYDEAGTKLISTGATAQSGTSTVQEFDITDTLFGPGLFYLAGSASSASTSSRCLTSLGGDRLAQLGVYFQSSAHVLPTTATFAEPSDNRLPIIGLTTRTLI